MIDPRIREPAAVTMGAHDEPAVRFDESFSRAAEAIGVIDQELMVAGRPVVVRYAGPGLQDVFRRPFTHLEKAHDGEPDLTISVWDSADSMVPPPPLPPVPPAAEAGDRSIVKRDDLRAVYHLGPSLLTAIAPHQGRAWVWIADRNSIPFWEAAAPFKMVWRWWLAELGHTMLHAGAVAHNGGGALLVGRGGRGKSTATVACLEAGFSYVGDDYVALDADGETIHSLYCTAKLKDDHAGRFARLAPTDIGVGIGGPGAGRALDKRVLLLTEVFPEQVVSSLSIGVVVAPRLELDRPNSRFSPLATASAMLATAASSMIQLPDSRPVDLAAMARLVERMPAYSLLIGNDVGQIPSAVGNLIAEAAHA